jgi:hypothetical protein
MHKYNLVSEQLIADIWVCRWECIVDFYINNLLGGGGRGEASRGEDNGELAEDIYRTPVA